LLLLALIFACLARRRRQQQAELDAIGFGTSTESPARDSNGAPLAPTPSPRFAGRPTSFLSSVRGTLGLAPPLPTAQTAYRHDAYLRPSLSPFDAGYGYGATALAAGLAGGAGAGAGVGIATSGSGEASGGSDYDLNSDEQAAFDYDNAHGLDRSDDGLTTTRPGTSTTQPSAIRDTWWQT
jgi:hypothetical protein